MGTLSMSAIRLAIVGLGKIARDQHLPAIAATPGIELTAIASRNAAVEGVPHFPTLSNLLANGLPITAELDFLQTGPQTWDIHIETDAGRLTLSGGGARLLRDGKVLVDQKEAEYKGIYARFAELVRRGESDVDITPLIHVADAFMPGRRTLAAPFEG